MADVCGMCHREPRDRFRESPHFAASRRGSMHQCITCHGNHAVSHPDFAMFDAKTDPPGEDRGVARCLSCHDAEKLDDKGTQTALAFGKGLREAYEDLLGATKDVDAIEAAGFHVDEERDTLEQARRELVRTVPLTHTVDRARVEAVLLHVHSIVEQARSACAGRVREERDRRIFGSVAGVVLLVIAGVLGMRRLIARKG